MKKKCFGAILVAAAILLVTSFTASVIHAAPVWEQPPVSWGHRVNSYQSVADDFQLSQSTNISSVQWWGKDEGGDAPWEIKIYGNALNDTDNVPGAEIHTFSPSVSAQPYVWDDDAGDWDYENYIFNANISFTANAGQLYWMSIKTPASSGWTGWRPAGTDTLTYLNTRTWYNGTEWAPDPAAGDYQNDLSFELEGTAIPIPGAVWLLGSGLVCLVGVRKKLKS